MIRTLTARLALVAIALVFCALPVNAKGKPTACPDGTFAVEGTQFTTAQGAVASSRIALADKQASISNLCDTPVRAKGKARKKFTKVTAKWRTCGDLRKVRLKAKVSQPDCNTMEGFIKAKGLKPKKQKFTAMRVPRAVTLAETLFDLDVQDRMSNENFPFFIRPAAEFFNPEVAELIAMGPAAVDHILEAFDGPTDLFDDTPLSLLAYALERIGDPGAIPVLADWLEQNLFTVLLWAPDLVTHAIKVLDGQSGLNTTNFIYGVDAMLDTIAQVPGRASGAARAGVAAPAAHVRRAAATAPGEQAQCRKTIIVTAIKDEQQVSVEIPYRTVDRKLSERIASLPDGSERKKKLQKKKENIEKQDNEFYGGEYLPIPGGEVGTWSNCGGSVTERLLNAVAEQKGFPVRLSPGTTAADTIRNLARDFGEVISGTEIDEFTVIAHEQSKGNPLHVEIPIEDLGNNQVLVYSKDNQGLPRTHVVDTRTIINFFGPVQRRYNFKPFVTGETNTTPKFYRIDPSKIVNITLDSSACPCGFGGNPIPVAITAPSEAETEERVITVSGTIGDASVTSGSLRVNGSPQGIDVSGGGFSAQVVLQSGDNTVRVAVDGPDGRRGCTEQAIRSNTPKSTLSATLTWNLDSTDVDLYTSQPDGETSWYSDKITTIGGRLDVDNTRGFGPENYFLSFEEGDTILTGTYTVRVHYYRDRLSDVETPTRAVGYRVVMVANEGAPNEKRKIATGTLSVDDSGNSSPGSTGPDWATVGQFECAEDGNCTVMTQ
jgi:uncharacterized protein YfaP (DUF2135 family)